MMLKSANKQLASILLDNAIMHMMNKTQLSYLECTELLQLELAPHTHRNKSEAQPMVVSPQESDFITGLFH